VKVFNYRLQRLTEQSLIGLQNLDTLDVSDNKLDYIDGAFAGMRRLSRLDLRNNDITTLTQFSLRDLENLQYLLLSGNRISAVERDTFQNLGRLSYLVLSGNPLGNYVQRLDITSTLLTFVDLAECGLQLLPKGLPPSIRYLQLRRNNITTLRKNSLLGYPNVGILILDDNGLLTIENKTFIHMTHLQQLWLNGNNLSSVPGSLPSSLQRLYLDNNKITLLTDTFPPNSQIDTLNLMNNRITSVSSDALRRLPKLRSLDLSGNRVTELRGHTFSKNTQLRRLLLSKNPLHTFHHHSFRGLRNLRILSLAHVEEDPTLPNELFSDFKQLRSLDLTNSPGLIQAFLDACVAALAFDELKNVLRIARTLVTMQTASVDSMATIEELKISGSTLTHVPHEIFDAFPALTSLQLSSTRFHCDDTMAWLRDWLRVTRVRVDDPIGIVCYSPRHLYLKPIASLADDDFALATPTAVAQLPTKSVAIATDNDNEYDVSGSGDGFTTADNDYENIGENQSADDIDKHEVQSYDSGNDFDQNDFADFENDFFSATTQVSVQIDTRFRDELSSTKVPSTDDSRTFLTDKTIVVNSNVETSANVSDKTPQIKSDNRFSNDNNNDNNNNNNNVRRVHNKNADSKHADGFESKIENEEVSTNFELPTNQTISSSLSFAASAAVVTLTLLITIGTAVVLVYLIVRLIRKQHASKRGDNSYHGHGTSRSVAKLNKKANGGGNVLVAVATNGSVKNLTTAQSVLGESMTLIPGRDINHEGPLRVYTWEDF
jgi:Leucine-rich repeat (LRR) protein